MLQRVRHEFIQQLQGQVRIPVQVSEMIHVVICLSIHTRSPLNPGNGVCCTSGCMIDTSYPVCTPATECQTASQCQVDGTCSVGLFLYFSCFIIVFFLPFFSICAHCLMHSLNRRPRIMSTIRRARTHRCCAQAGHARFQYAISLDLRHATLLLPMTALCTALAH